MEAGPWPWAHASCLQVEVEEVHPSWARLWLWLPAGLRKPQPFPCPSALHPRNVLELIEFFEEEDRFYLVFEKMRGGTWGLAQFLSGSRWAWGLRATREKLPGGLPIRGTLGGPGWRPQLRLKGFGFKETRVGTSLPGWGGCWALGSGGDTCVFSMVWPRLHSQPHTQAAAL